MIFEMACYRGIMVWIDGEKPEKGWGCGTGGNGNTLTSSDLQIGPHRIEAIEVIGPEHDDCNPDAGVFHVFENALVPKEIELRTADGKWRGPVTKIVTANENVDLEVVKLANGEDYEIDEITLYLRAILQPIN
tara:strand:+ start:3489 stop:3887 length:399 start_codon:yes stop_codon:yes gene_type:complete